ncbi:MAG: PKD domain-containing protein [Flavobacteriales bacterium]|nr:PKD domain-containing protein [Flavobacteriales bacterium]
MKKFYRRVCMTGLLVGACTVMPVMAQNAAPFKVGNFEQWKEQSMVAGKTAPVTSLQVSQDMEFHIQMNVHRQSDNGDFALIGKPLELNRADFYIDQVNGDFQGALINYDNKTAWRFTLDANGNLISTPENINKLVCVDYDRVEAAPGKAENPDDVATVESSIPQLESLPGAKAVLYLDFDGETVSGSRWNNGNTIYATARNYSDSKIQTIFDVVSDDYAPWTINVTTIRSKYDNASTNSRMMAIFTATDDAASGAGGVAYLGSFDDGRNDPCWVYNDPTQACATTAAHEPGHTFGLNHDGTTTGDSYYMGNDLWGPIMGAPFNEKVMHWSKGSYPNANNSENDYTIIDGNTNVDYKTDDYGNTTAAASDLVHTNGTVNVDDDKGLIEKQTDKDVFKFETEGGNASFTVMPENKNWPNLNVQARILDSNGNEVAKNSSTEDAHTVNNIVSSNLAKGIYYLEIDGVGLARGWTGSPHGYDDYCSTGYYTISGSFVPKSQNVPPTVDFVASETAGCGSLTVQFTDKSTNSPTSWLWNFGDGGTSSQQNPSHTYSTAGTFNVSLKATNGFGSNTQNQNGLITVGAGTTYSSATGGPADDSFGTGGLFTSNDIRGLFFDAQTDIILESFKFNSGEAGDRQIDIISGGTMNTTDGGVDGGTVVATTTVNIPNGTSEVPVNIELPQGNDYFIKITGSVVDLYRNDASASYPYQITDAQSNQLVSIKKANVLNGGDATYYYYFYNWKVRKQGCFNNTGLDNQQAELLQVFPNPANNTIHVQFAGNRSGNARVEMINALGAVVMQTQVGMSQNTLDIPSSTLPGGIYLVRVVQGDQLSQQRVVIAH